MKKRYKILLTLAAITAGTQAINQTIFKLSNKTKPKNNLFRIEWRHGIIKYRVFGKGEPLLLIHNTFIGSSMAEWKELALKLSKNYTVYCIDLLGFGFSDKPNLTYSAYLYVSLINDFVAEVIGQKTFAIASNDSCGFLVSAALVAPDNFKKLILVSPSIGKEKKSYLKDPSNRLIKKIIELPIFGTFVYNMLASKNHIRYYLEEHAYYDDSLVSKEMIENYHKCAHHMNSNVKIPIASFMAGDFNLDLEKQLAKLKTPSCLVFGEESEIPPIKGYKGKTSHIPKTRLYPHSEKSKEFSNICLKFFE